MIQLGAYFINYNDASGEPGPRGSDNLLLVSYEER